MCIGGRLAEYHDGWSSLRDDACGCIDNLEGIEFMVVNASDIDHATVCVEDPGVIAKNSTVCPSIDT